MTTSDDCGIKDLAVGTCQSLASVQQLLDAGLVPLHDAAVALGIEDKRLAGFVVRNQLDDPIGGWSDHGMAVYGWSCRALAAKLAATVRETVK